MKYLNVIFLMSSSFVFAMNEVVDKPLCIVSGSHAQYWHVDKEIKTEKNNFFKSVHFDKDDTKIITVPKHGDRFIVYDRDGKVLQRVEFGAMSPLYQQLYSLESGNYERFLQSATKDQKTSFNKLLNESSDMKEKNIRYKDFTFNSAITSLVTWDFEHIGTSAYVWDRITVEKLCCLEHDGGINMARFNGDGSKIVTASNDRTMRLWDGITGKELLRIMYDRCVKTASFNAQGTEIVVSLDDGTIQIISTVPSDISIFS